MHKKLRCLIFSFLALYAIRAPAQTFITVKGKEIIGADHKPFMIRGTNIGNWLLPEGYMFKFGNTNSGRAINEAFSQLMGPTETRNFWKKFQQNYIRQADIRYLQQTGINTIRIPFSYQLFTNEEYMGSSDPGRGFRLLDSLVAWCRPAGIYLILDLHAAPGGQTGDNIDNGYGYPFLYTDPESRKQTIDTWKKIAAHYKNEPVVMGYDLLNEPIAHYFPQLNPYLEPLYKEITRAIRTVDTSHLVFLGGAQWDGNFKVFGAPFDSKAVYTFHKYWMPVEQKAIQPYVDFSEKYNVPIYCGETGENKDPWIHDFKELLEKNKIGYTYWCYKKMDNLSGFLSFDAPNGYDKIIAYAEKNRSSFAMIREARPKNLAALKDTLFAVLNNCLLENCTVNPGYIEALGFKPVKIEKQPVQGLQGMVKPGALPVKISSAFKFTEGPAVDGQGNIFFTDQPDDKIWEYSAQGQLSLFMEHAGRANGMHSDHHGNLIVCADSLNQLWEISPSKKIKILVKNFQHHLLNGPNDVWVDRKGGLYITDPYYARDYWKGTHPDLPGQNVYFLPRGSHSLALADSSLKKPNGIVGTADGKTLYIADIQADKTYKYTIGADGRLSNKELFFNQGSDGMTLDHLGNIYTTGKGVTVYNPSGKKIGHIDIPEDWTANVCFGGKNRNNLFITASHSIYELPMLVHGIE